MPNIFGGYICSLLFHIKRGTTVHDKAMQRTRESMQFSWHVGHTTHCIHICHHNWKHYHIYICFFPQLYIAMSQIEAHRLGVLHWGLTCHLVLRCSYWLRSRRNVTWQTHTPLPCIPPKKEAYTFVQIILIYLLTLFRGGYDYIVITQDVSVLSPLMIHQRPSSSLCSAHILF